MILRATTTIMMRLIFDIPPAFHFYTNQIKGSTPVCNLPFFGKNHGSLPVFDIDRAITVLQR